MKAELEGLILAREALLEARSGEEASHARSHYQTSLRKSWSDFPICPIEPWNS